MRAEPAVRVRGGRERKAAPKRSTQQANVQAVGICGIPVLAVARIAMFYSAGGEKVTGAVRQRAKRWHAQPQRGKNRAGKESGSAAARAANRICGNRNGQRGSVSAQQKGTCQQRTGAAAVKVSAVCSGRARRQRTQQNAVCTV